MTSNLDMHSSAAVKNDAKEEEKRQNFRRASKKLFWCAFVPIPVGFIFSNGLFLFLSPIILWLSWMCFIVSLNSPKKVSHTQDDCSSSMTFELPTSSSIDDEFNDYLNCGTHIGRSLYPYYSQISTYD